MNEARCGVTLFEGKAEPALMCLEPHRKQILRKPTIDETRVEAATRRLASIVAGFRWHYPDQRPFQGTREIRVIYTLRANLFTRQVTPRAAARFKASTTLLPL